LDGILEVESNVSLTVTSVSDYLYSKDCQSFFQDEWVKKTESSSKDVLHVLFYLINAATVTSAAINFVTHLCDEGNKETNCLFVLLIHFPQENTFLGMKMNNMEKYFLQ
jgi:hypothetical protein